MLTLWLTLSLGIAPLGLAVGAPLVTVLGARATLWLSAGSTLALALLTALLAGHRRSRRTARRPDLDTAA